MTDKDKPEQPETPGMAEVSAKFVHQTEAAVETAASTDENLPALWQEWQRRCEANDKAIEDEDKAKLAKEAITDHETPEYRAATAEFEAAQKRPGETFAALMAVEDRIENTAARSVKGAATKLRVAKYWIDVDYPDGPSGETKMSREKRLSLSVLADLERLGGEVAPIGKASVIEDPVLVLRQRWENAMVERGQLKNRDNENPKHPDVLEDERLHDVQHDLEEAVANTPTHTAAGIVAKLLQLQRNETEFDGDAPWRPTAFRTALEALGRGTMSTIEDPVLVLKREWEARYKALDEDRDDPDTDDSDKAMQPFYDRLHETEVQILRTQATTPAGVAIKLILWARLHCSADEVSGLSWTRKSIEGHPHDLDQLPVLSALLDLERMSSGTMAPEAPAVPVIDEPLLALERRMFLARDLIDDPETDTTEALENEFGDTQDQIAEMPASSLAGVAVKLRLVQASKDWMGDGEFGNKTLLSAIASVERLASEGVTVALQAPAKPEPSGDDVGPAADVSTTATAPLVRAKTSDLERVVSNLEGASNALNNVVQSDDLPTEVDIGLQWLAYQIDAGIVDLRDECDKLQGAEAIEQAPIAGDTSA